MNGPRSVRVPTAPVFKRFISVVGAAALLAMATGLSASFAADPTPPFTECPASGHAPSCNVLIVFNADGSVGIFQGQTTRIDNDEDTLVGVRNSSGTTIPNVILSSNDANIHPFAFDGDGMCTTAARSQPRPAGCPYQTTGTGHEYAGPGITYTDISADTTTGKVNFASSCTQTTTCTSTPDGLQDGTTVFFSLEDKVDAGNIIVPGRITSAKTASESTAHVGDVITYTIKLSNSGSVAATTDVTDDYDEAHLTNISTISNGGVNNSPSPGMIKWTGVSVPPGANTVTLSYQGTISGSFSGGNGTCPTGQFPVVNTVTLSNGDGTSNTVCVQPQAPAHITSNKTASKTTAQVGDVITYTIKLSNSGDVAGTTDVVDDYDQAHLTNISNISNGGVNNSPAPGEIKWTGVSVPPGTDTVTLSYQGTITGPFSGSNGDCGPNKFPVINTVTLTNGGGDSNEICVEVPTNMTGHAFGVSLDLLGSNLIPPTAEAGPVSTPNDSTDEECLLDLPIPGDPGAVIDVKVLCGRVTTIKATKTSKATASVAHVTLALPGAPVIEIGAVETSSTTTCAGSVGHTNIVSLKVDGVEQLPFEDFIPANTVIPLGIGELRLNEQIPITGAEKGLTVNAVHLDLPGIADLIVSSAESDISGC